MFLRQEINCTPKNFHAQRQTRRRRREEREKDTPVSMCVHENMWLRQPVFRVCNQTQAKGDGDMNDD